MMRLIVFFFGFFFFFIQSCYGLVITFKPLAKVDGISVSLSEIAQFNVKSELTTALGSQIVSQSPAPGRDIILQTANIKSYLVNSLQIPDSVSWKGPVTILVHRRGVQIGPEKIQTIISGYLTKRQNDLPDAKIHFIPNSLPLPFILPTGDLSWEVIPSNPGVLKSSSISIIFSVDGHIRKNIAVSGRIEAMAPVIVAAATIPHGGIITKNSISILTRDIADTDSPYVDLKELVGKKTKRVIREGSIIEHSWIDIPPMVARGQVVKIVLSSGALRVTATGIAKMNGVKNQVIRVRNISSHKLLYCRVTAPGIVEVRL